MSNVRMRPSAPWRPAVAIVMPSYNEEGLAGFIDEIHAVLLSHVGSLRFVVVDDCSPTVTPHEVLSARHLQHVEVVRSPTNRGHGPTVMAAYERGLGSPCDVVVHVDGDGQFHGEDFLAVINALRLAEVAVGERGGRTDPWFRQVITAMLPMVLSGRSGAVRDINSPLRAYRRSALELLHPLVHPDSRIPHITLTLRMAELGLRVAAVPVRSRARLGATECGTTWTDTRFQALPPRRLVRFCAGAGWELFCTLLSPRRGTRRVVKESTMSPAA